MDSAPLGFGEAVAAVVVVVAAAAAASPRTEALRKKTRKRARFAESQGKESIKPRINRRSSGSKRPGIGGGSRECRAEIGSDRSLRGAVGQWRAACYSCKQLPSAATR